MKKVIIAVFDAAVGQYTDPATVRSEMEAIRAFSAQVNTPGTDFNEFPEDYTLFALGEYDPVTGVIVNHEKPTKLGHAAALLTRAPSAEAQIDFVAEDGPIAPH